MSDEEPTVELFYQKIEAETDQAWLVYLGHPFDPPLQYPLWFPKSECKLTTDKRIEETNCRQNIIVVPSWLYHRKMEEYELMKKERK